MTTTTDLDRVLDHYVLGIGTDEEIADELGLTPADVRERRAQRATDLAQLDLTHRLREIASVERWRGSLAELLERILNEALLSALEERDEIEALEALL